MTLDPVQVREAFHCLVLQHLAPGFGLDLRVKGGVNLRFYYGSERYSEDMDLDAAPRLRQRLKASLPKILHGPAIRRELLRLGIRDLDLPDRPAKDTDTVLRYKLGLFAGGVRYPTKIEVSYRSDAPATWATLARPLAEIVDPYRDVGTTYPEVGHYGRTAAVLQKIKALALRGEVQARDVFDLNVLLSPKLDERLPAVDVELLRGHLSDRVLADAFTRTFQISVGEFKDQVAEFLPPGTRSTHTANWDDTQLHVAIFIESLKR